MWLINTKSLQLDEFNERDAPPYAILSHTWGSPNEEVDFRGMHCNARSQMISKTGYQKIVGTCEQARKGWLDGAELTEAINSMFRWYEKAEICLAYLADVSAHGNTIEGFISGRWFTRGWTLQELIAPRKLRFFASNWEAIGDRGDMAELLSARTGIDKVILERNYSSSETGSVGSMLRNISVARKFSWASLRKTTRREDMAYCLFGIFAINMPLIYGESKGAFIRLQEKIVRRTDDQTIFAWNCLPGAFGTDFQLVGYILQLNPSSSKTQTQSIPWS
ncbi:hypothetical protein B0T16DRAFT_429712 [Cercophora newfieldiana]|uniref:DUF8212 domain-containing protein n=1 Tax=Cercophora newfieldiana TaxID=92897 RepID=A0AA39Y6Z3_9PEZI|nr:hypothetical protein B0T16DRAFT_429712 [Cercophora newfieldiana]